MLKSSKNSDCLLACEICGGSGRSGLTACHNCQGAGLANLVNGKLYFWEVNISYALVYLARFKRLFDWFIELALIGFGFWGVWLLAEYIYITTVYQFNFFELFQVQNQNFLVFWLSVLTDCFFFYRVSEYHSAKQKILQFTEGDLFFESPEVRHLNMGQIKNRNKVDIFGGFSLLALKKIESAILFAIKMRSVEVLPAHMLSVILKDAEVAKLIRRLDLDIDDVVLKLSHQLALLPASNKAARLSRELKGCFILAYEQAAGLGERQVRPIHLLMPILSADKNLKEIFYSFAVEERDVINAVNWFAVDVRMHDRYRRFTQLAHFKPGTNMNRAYTAQATPLLNAYGHDLTLYAKNFSLDYCTARDFEIDQIFSEVNAGRRNVMLVGEPGVGKYTIVGGLAQLMVEESVPGAWHDKRLVELDISRLLSGTAASDAQARLQQILDEVSGSGNIIVFIKNIETIAGISSGSDGSLDLADVLINHLERTGLICLATATRENYAKFVEHRPLGLRFAKVEVPEPNHDQAIMMLESKVAHFEKIFKVYFTYGALDQLVTLSSKYLHESYLPAKAIDALESVAVAVSHPGREVARISREEVTEVVSKIAGVPINKVGGEEREELLNMEERIHDQMIGQAEAVKAVSAALRRARTQMTQGKRPIASFLFLGPTGVGKTELTKAIARVYFGSEKYLTRLDMSEYQAQESISKMIGDVHGQKGYLTEAVRKNPFTLLLLDEFEKAHPEILNLFLQVMDDGRLTDGDGRTIDFTNAIVIATSNAGANFIQESIVSGLSTEEIQSTLINEHLNKIMRPELINRFDGVIVFKPLGETEVVSIARLLIGKIAENLGQKGIELRLSEAGLHLLAHQGFDPKFGARPMRRLLQDKVENIIAERILEGNLQRRDTVVIGDDGSVTIEKAAAL